MASTYTSSLRINLQGTGDNDGTWGTVANQQFQLFEDAITGVVQKALSAGNNVLSTNNGSTDESRNALVWMTGALVSAAAVIMPDVEKVQAFYNGTTGNQTITVKNSAAGTSIAIPSSAMMFVWTDGVTIRSLTNPVDYQGSPLFTNVSLSTGTINTFVAQNVSTSVLNVSATASVATGKINTLNVVTAASIAGTLTATGATSLASTLTVAGATSITGAVNITGAVSTAAGITTSTIDAKATVSASTVNAVKTNFTTASASVGIINNIQSVNVSTSTLWVNGVQVTGGAVASGVYQVTVVQTSAITSSNSGAGTGGVAYQSITITPTTITSRLIINAGISFTPYQSTGAAQQADQYSLVVGSNLAANLGGGSVFLDNLSGTGVSAQGKIGLDIKTSFIYSPATVATLTLSTTWFPNQASNTVRFNGNVSSGSGNRPLGPSYIQIIEVV